MASCIPTVGYNVGITSLRLSILGTITSLNRGPEHKFNTLFRQYVTRKLIKFKYLDLLIDTSVPNVGIIWLAHFERFHKETCPMNLSNSMICDGGLSQEDLYMV